MNKQVYFKSKPSLFQLQNIEKQKYELGTRQRREQNRQKKWKYMTSTKENGKPFY